jgi:hypothetical protein
VQAQQLQTLVGRFKLSDAPVAARVLPAVAPPARTTPPAPPRRPGAPAAAPRAPKSAVASALVNGHTGSNGHGDDGFEEF